VAALADPAWRSLCQSRDVTVLYIHGLNPYGFSHLRRTTHENVDLNRNFHDFSAPLPVNAAYREVQPLLIPQEWPPGADNQAAVESFLANHGAAAFQAAITRGQHEFPDGMFFGGTSACWSNLTVREVLRRHGQKAKRIAWIDIHTGLGPAAVGERIYAGRDDPTAVQRAREWWDGGGRTPVTSIYDGSSVSAFLTGMLFNAAYDQCPHVQYTGLALEFGTVPMQQTLQALRGEQWLLRNPLAPTEQAQQIRQQLKGAFYTDTDGWKEQVVRQSGGRRLGTEPAASDFEQAVENQAVDQFELNRHARRHLPASATSHDAGRLGPAMLAHMLHHAFHGTGDGIGAATGQCITGIGREFTYLAGGHVQTGGAGLERAQHDAVAGKDEAAQEAPPGVNRFHRDRRADHHHHQWPCRAPCQHSVPGANHRHPAVGAKAAGMVVAVGQPGL
jgi:hypothetical protein